MKAKGGQERLFVKPLNCCLLLLPFLLEQKTLHGITAVFDGHFCATSPKRSSDFLIEPKLANLPR